MLRGCIGWTDQKTPEATAAAPIGKPERQYGIVYVMPSFGCKCEVFSIRKGIEWHAVRAFQYFLFCFASLPFRFVFVPMLSLKHL